MKYTKDQVYDLFILILRWYLAFYMIDYGWGKINGEQFGIFNQEVLNSPLKDVDKFNLAWYLFSLDKTFNIIVGITQIIGGVLIIINRTTLIGALILLPVLAQIFLIDLAFTTEMFGHSLTIRLSCMIFSDILILLYYKEKMILVWKNLTNNISTKFNYKWWVFLVLPILGFITDFIFGILSYPLKLLIEWSAK